MILDTGAGATIISKAAARRLGLEKAGERCAGMGAGGDVQMEMVSIDTFTVGSVSRGDVSSMTKDLPAICDKLGYEIDGIVGYDFLVIRIALGRSSPSLRSGALTRVVIRFANR